MGHGVACRRGKGSRLGSWGLVLPGLVCLGWVGMALEVLAVESIAPPAPVALFRSALESPLLAAPDETLLRPSMRLDLSQSEEVSGTAAGGGASRGRYALPMFLSALIPGAGEISMGHWWNGLPLVVVDVATWMGYAHYQSEGDSWKDTYQQFADAHWAEDRWQTNLEAASQQPPNAWDGYWDPTAPYNCDCSPPYIPKDEDAHEYYENLGKYNHFYPGWDDFNDYPDYSYDPENPNTHRRQYVDMRIESNDNYDNSHTLLGVAAVTRIISVIQSYWLVRRDSRREGLQLQPMTYRGFGSGLRLTWSF